MIVAVGYANLDLLVSVPGLPEPGERVHASSIERRSGGMAANAAAAAGRFGARVAFVGAVGLDADGRMLLDDLSACGVDVGATVTNRWTSTAVILVAPDGQRAIISQDDAVGPSELRRALERLVPGGGFLYLDGYRWPWAADHLAELPPGVQVVVDLDGLADAAALPRVAKVAAHLMASRAHLAGLLRGKDPEAVARLLAGTHDVTVVLTDGTRGWWLTDGTSTSHGPALPAATVDTTGAGDAFCGVYTAALDAGADPTKAAELAAAAAAISTTARGARSALATRDDAEALLAAATTPAGEPPPENRKG